MDSHLKERFRGCLLGLAIGDALGGRFEGQSADFIRQRFPTVRELINYDSGELWYTDDTQMAIGVAETLAEHREIIEEQLCKAFVANYVPSRGYGFGARAVLDAMEEGGDYRAVAANTFPGGSYGNGAAMRVAPVGLFYRDDFAALFHQSRASALPTHLHALGVEGAQLLALAVALASRMEAFDHDLFFADLQAHCQSNEYGDKVRAAAKVESAAALIDLGNGIQALESVATAIASFALAPNSYEETIGNVILLGGDTDTMAAMAGAISGAFLGYRAIPAALVNKLEETPKGRRYIVELADSLFIAYQVKATPAAASNT